MRARPALCPSRLLILVALAVGCAPVLSGCGTVSDAIGRVVDSNSRTMTLSMHQLSPSLSGYERKEGYNYLGESVEYRQIGVPEYDAMFLRAAYIKGTVQQLTAMVERFQAGGLSVDTEEDYLFLRAMAEFGMRALPSLVREAPTLAGQIVSLRPHTDVPPQRLPAALAGIDQMRSNLTGMDPSALSGLLDTVTSIQCQVQAAADGARYTNC